jgi:hypothetical protein
MEIFKRVLYAAQKQARSRPKNSSKSKFTIPKRFGYIYMLACNLATNKAMK